MSHDMVETYKLIQDMHPESTPLEGDLITLEEMFSIPKGDNPFNHDLYHMGTIINGITFMYASDKTYMIIVFPNGKRVKMKFDESLFN